jgi:hypothetical protein
LKVIYSFISDLAAKKIEIVLVLGILFCACSKEKLKMPVAHPFPRIGLGEIEQQIRLLDQAKHSTGPGNVRQKYGDIKILISMFLQEGVMVDDILTRAQGEEIESLLRHNKDEEASKKVNEAIDRLRKFRESDEYLRFRRELDEEPVPTPHLIGEEHRKKIWLRENLAR